MIRATSPELWRPSRIIRRNFIGVAASGAMICAARGDDREFAALNVVSRAMRER
jgi:hypothetical protein